MSNGDYYTWSKDALADRIRKLEAKLEGYELVKARMSFEADRAAKLEVELVDAINELAALKQRKPALNKFNELGGPEIQDPIERLRFFCSLVMSGQNWLDVEPFFDALKQGEPVAWIVVDKFGSSVFRDAPSDVIREQAISVTPLYLAAAPKP